MKSRFAPVVAFGLGGLFGLGLLIGGMTQPSKVVGFLDVAGAWDPSLAFVMGGAVAVFAPLYRLVVRRRTPLLAKTFSLPSRKDIDGQLLLGAALFGVGWGLAGYCPGPAITALGSVTGKAALFVAAMIVGFALKRAWDERAVRSELNAGRQ